MRDMRHHKTAGRVGTRPKRAPADQQGRLRAASVVLGSFLGNALLLGAASSADAADRERGSALYENHCTACHEDWVYKRVQRKVKSLDELRRRVAGWSEHAALNWKPEEIEDVVIYLDEEFYKFR